MLTVNQLNNYPFFLITAKCNAAVEVSQFLHKAVCNASVQTEMQVAQRSIKVALNWLLRLQK